MSRSILSRHLGLAIAFAGFAVAVTIPLLNGPIAAYRAVHAATARARTVVLQAEGALERGESPDVMADRIGARAGFRIVVVRRDGRVLGDTARDGRDLGVTSPGLRAFEEEVRARGLVDKIIAHEGVSSAAAGIEYGPGFVVMAVRPTDGYGADGSALSRAVGLGLAAILILALGFSVALSFVLRPARELGVIAKAIALGNLSVRARTGSDDELGELGRAIDGVADQLRVRMERLATEEARLEAVLDSMTEAVFVTDATGTIVLTNEAFSRIARTDSTGRTPIEAIRSPELHRAVASVQGGRPTSVEFEIPVEGARRIVFATIAPMERGGGVVVVMHDVTRLKEIDEIRRDFVANASHELRTPLTAIRGYAETLRGGAHGQPETAERFLDVILRHTIRLQRIVDDLVSLSRAESPDSGFELDEVDAREVLLQVVRGLETNAVAREISLEVELPESLPATRTNENALDQILVNLVDNAIKYTPVGGRVRITGVRRETRLELSVWNSGPGIPAAHLDRIFERFYRVDPGRSREVGGTGLGLSIVKHLGQRIGAEVTVESAKEKGTTFRVSLPLAEPGVVDGSAAGSES